MSEEIKQACHELTKSWEAIGGGASGQYHGNDYQQGLRTAYNQCAYELKEMLAGVRKPATPQTKKAKGDVDGALVDYSKAIELKPSFAEAYINRGGAKYRKEDLDGALADYSRAIELKPDDAEAYYGRGSVKYRKGDLDGALADYSRAIELKPDYAESYYGRGSAKCLKGDLDGALADYSKTIELKPGYAAVYYNRASAKKAKGDLEGALADLSKAIELDPKNAVAYRSRGILRYEGQAWAEALADLRRGVELSPADDYGRIFVWMARTRLGETAAARKELQDFLTARQGKVDDWAAKVGGFLAGQMTEADFLKAAASADAKTEKERHCEAYFYAGTKWLIDADKVTAKDCFEKCIASDVREFVEYQSALAELKLLKLEK